MEKGILNQRVILLIIFIVKMILKGATIVYFYESELSCISMLKSSPVESDRSKIALRSTGRWRSTWPFLL